MNYYKNQTLAVFLVFLLALPAVMFLKLPGAQSRNFFANAIYSGIRIVSPPPQAAKVVISNNPLSSSIVPNRAASNSFTAGGCSFFAPSPVLELQDASFVNLNQPAGCFSLKLAVLSSQSELKVVTGFPNWHAQVVVLNKSVIESASLLPAFPVSEKAVMGFYFLLLNLGFAVAAGVVKRRKSAGLKNFVSLLSIFELKVLRC